MKFGFCKAQKFHMPKVHQKNSFVIVDVLKAQSSSEKFICDFWYFKRSKITKKNSVVIFDVSNAQSSPEKVICDFWYLKSLKFISKINLFTQCSQEKSICEL